LFVPEAAMTRASKKRSWLARLILSGGFPGEVFLSKTHIPGDDAGAVVDCSKAIELDPDECAAYVNRAFAYAKMGDMDRAIEDWNRLIERMPRNVEAYDLRGLMKLMKGDFAGAIADCSKSIDINPDYHKAYATRGLAQLLQGKDNEAQRDFERCLELRPDFKPILDKNIRDAREKRLQKQ
jgi:tetratricopeptide (TPR) repeat protein